MKDRNILIRVAGSLVLACLFIQASAQKVSPVTKPGIQVGKEMKMHDGLLYYSTQEGKDYKIWTYEVAKKKQKLLMKSKENIGHFYEIEKTLLFSFDRGHPGEDGQLYYIDEHGKPVEVQMPSEAGVNIDPGHGRHLEIYPYRHGFLILAPVQDGKNKYKLYKYGLKQDSARRLMPGNYYIHPGLVASPDAKMLIAAVEVTPQHPWENSREFWNKWSQLFIIQAVEGEPFTKWMDHAELYDAGFRYTNRTWMNVHYKELKDKGNDVDHHSVFVIANPSEKKGTMPKHVGEAIDTSMFFFEKKICYYMGHKGNVYLVAAFEYTDNYRLKYGKLSGHDMKDFTQVQGQFVFDSTLHIITKHKGVNDYYSAWTLKTKFDTAEWLEAHVFMSGVNYDARLSSTLPTQVELKVFKDTLGNPVYLSDGPRGATNRLFTVSKGGPALVGPRDKQLPNINNIAESWKGNFMLKQKDPGQDAEQLVLKCKGGAGNICSPGDRYEPGYCFECNNMLFFSIFSAQTKRRFNWQSDGTLEGTKRMDLGDMSLQLDFSKPIMADNAVFVIGKINQREDAKDQLFVIEM